MIHHGRGNGDRHRHQYRQTLGWGSGRMSLMYPCLHFPACEYALGVDQQGRPPVKERKELAKKPLLVQYQREISFEPAGV